MLGKSLTAACMLVGLATGVAQANPAPVGSERDRAFEVLQRIVRADREFSALLRSTRNQVMRLDIDGDGLSKSDDEHWERIDVARRRANNMREWLRKDLNGDGTVTRDELSIIHGPEASRPFSHSTGAIAKTPGQIAQILDRLLAKSLSADADKDGSITFQEALVAANAKKPPAYRRKLNHNSGYARFAPFDADRDGKVTLEEIETSLMALLKEYDENQDGQFDQNELRKFKSRARSVKKSRGTLKEL